MEDFEKTFLECGTCEIRFNGLENFQQHLKGHKHKTKVKHQQEKHNRKNLKENEVNSADNDADEDDFSLKCDVCRKSFSSEIPYYQHLKSGTHKKALKKKEIVEEIARKNPGIDETSLLQADAQSKSSFLPESYATCKECYKDFSGPESFLQHLKSATHRKKLKELALRKKLVEAKILDPTTAQEQHNEDKESYEKKMESALGDDDVNFDISVDPNGEDIQTCEVCKKSFSGLIPFAQHLESKTHKKKLKMVKVMEIVNMTMERNNSDSDSSEATDDEEESLTCEMCDIAFSSPINMLAHLTSKKHLKLKKFLKFKKQLELSQEESGDDRVFSSEDVEAKSKSNKNQQAEEPAKNVYFDNTQYTEDPQMTRSQQIEKPDRSIPLDKSLHTEKSTKNVHFDKSQGSKGVFSEKDLTSTSENINFPSNEEFKISGESSKEKSKKIAEHSTQTKMSNLQKVTGTVKSAYQEIIDE